MNASEAWTIITNDLEQHGMPWFDYTSRCQGLCAIVRLYSYNNIIDPSTASRMLGQINTELAKRGIRNFGPWEDPTPRIPITRKFAIDL